MTYDASSPGAIAYMSVAREIANRGGAPIKIKNDMDSENRGQTVGCNAKKPRKELAAAKVGNFLLSGKKNGSTELLKWFRLDN
jgi:hypothetical protein